MNPLAPETLAASPLTATHALRLLRAGDITAPQLLHHCQWQADRGNRLLNALIRTNPQARAEAEAAPRPSEAQPLAGLPISVKDAFATRDLITTASFAPLKHHQPSHDATVVARLRAAGAVLVGKTNLSELAGDPQCWSQLFGPTRNPWQPSHTPGGSSGGAAVAVACGFSLLDLGSDIGGSIRLPAAYCGVAGLKATENRIPRSGHIPHLPPQLSATGRSVRHLLSFGALARSVADLHLAYGLIAGPDGEDMEVPPFSPPPPLSSGPGEPLRIALWTEMGGLPLCPRTRQGLQALTQRLRAAGHLVIETRPPGFDLEAAWTVYGQLAGAEIGLGLPSWQRRLLAFFGPRLMAKDRLARSFAAGARLNLRAYNQALNAREALIVCLENFLAQWDAVICPVAATTAYPAFPLSANRPPPPLKVGDQSVPYLEATVGMTTPFSLTGHPVLTLPTGCVEGLPVGVQLLGRRWEEAALLQTGLQLEGTLGKFVPPPPY